MASSKSAEGAASGSSGAARARSAAAWEVARRQHGVITRRELLALGFSSKAIEHRLAEGRLHPIWRGVYAVGWPDLTPERRWMAAVLICGDGAALSHGSAAALWGIARECTGRIDVSVRRHCHVRRKGIRARSRKALRREDLVVRNRIPLTRPALTLVDLATELGDTALERAVNEADKLGLISAEALRTALEEYAGVPGVRRLRRLLDRYTFVLSDSGLEIRFRPIAAAAGLPPPLTKVEVNGFEVDFHWPDLGLVVETDGHTYHRTPSEQARDQLRDQTHVAAGLTTLRFSHHQVNFEAAHVIRTLKRTVDRLRG